MLALINALYRDLLGVEQRLEEEYPRGSVEERLPHGRIVVYLSARRGTQPDGKPGIYQNASDIPSDRIDELDQHPFHELTREIEQRTGLSAADIEETGRRFGTEFGFSPRRHDRRRGFDAARIVQALSQLDAERFATTWRLKHAKHPAVKRALARLGESAKQRGRPKVKRSSEREESRALAAWRTEKHRTYAECARELGGEWTTDKLRRLIDRNRKRRARDAGQT